MTNFERQMLLELLKIKRELSILNHNDEETTNINNEIIAVQNGYTEFYELGDDELSNEKSENWFTFIYDVLAMYSRMINSIANNQGSKHKHDISDVRFPGFDGNNELEKMTFVKFFIIRLKRYGEIEAINNGDYNSHREMTETYKRMLACFKKMGEPIILNDQQIDELLNS